MLPTFAFQAVKAATVTCVPCARAAARRASSSASAFFRAAAGSSLTEQTALAAPHRCDMGGIVGGHAVVFSLARKGGTWPPANIQGCSPATAGRVLQRAEIKAQQDLLQMFKVKAQQPSSPKEICYGQLRVRKHSQDSFQLLIQTCPIS